MRFLTATKQMSAERWLRFKKAFNQILRKNVEGSEVTIDVLLAFSSDPEIIEVIAAITVIDGIDGIDDRIEHIKSNWNGEEIEKAIEVFFNNFFFAQINKMTSTFTGIQNNMSKTIKKHK